MDPSKYLVATKRRNTQETTGNPFILGLFAFSILLTALLTSIFGYKFGSKQGYQKLQNELSAQGREQVVSAMTLDKLNQEVERLREQLDAARTERDISLTNFETMRDTIDRLEVENLQLEHINDVFGDQLADKGGLPLQVIGEKIEPLPEGAFEYRFDVAMLSDDNLSHRLTPTLTLFDEENLVEVPLEPRYYDLKGVARIRGRFMMPKGFVPKQAKLELRADGQHTEQIYNWRLAERMKKMPLSLEEVPEADQRPITEE